MKIFTGFHKKSTAGIVCALGVVFIFTAICSNAADVVSHEDAGTSNTAPQVIENTISENNNIISPVNANSSINAPKPTLPPQKTNSASQLASLLGGLVLILVLIYGLSWFVKRFSQGGFMQNPSMKIVSAMPLGTRERLMLVDVGGKQLLLGVTATQINTLHVFDEPVVLAEKTQPITSDFSQKLMAILQQKNVVSPNDTANKNSHS